MNWFEIKVRAVELTGLARDALHIHVGLFAFLAVALIARRPLSHPLPWLAVLLLSLGGEWYDLNYEVWPQRELQFQESLRDLWNTMLQPTLLSLLARFASSRLYPRADTAADPSGGDATE